MAIWGIFGILGSGKTTIALFLFENQLSDNKGIISNVHLNIPFEYMSVEEIFNTGTENPSYFANKILFLDEIHLLMESRRSTAGVNVEFSQNILIQLSKLDCPLVYTSQLLSQVDLRIKQMTKYFIFTQKLAYNNMEIEEYCNAYEKLTGIRINPDKRILPFDVIFDLIIAKRTSTGFVVSEGSLNPKKYFKQFNTREIITFDRKKFLKK